MLILVDFEADWAVIFSGKDIKDRPTVWGDPIYQTDVGLGPPIAGLPTQVRLLKR